MEGGSEAGGSPFSCSQSGYKLDQPSPNAKFPRAGKARTWKYCTCVHCPGGSPNHKQLCQLYKDCNWIGRCSYSWKAHWGGWKWESEGPSSPWDGTSSCICPFLQIRLNCSKCHFLIVSAYLANGPHCASVGKRLKYTTKQTKIQSWERSSFVMGSAALKIGLFIFIARDLLTEWPRDRGLGMEYGDWKSPGCLWKTPFSTCCLENSVLMMSFFQFQILTVDTKYTVKLCYRWL